MAIKPNDVIHFSRITGADPGEVRRELIAAGHFELLGVDLTYMTVRATVGYTSPDGKLGAPVAGGKILYATADLTASGRRRVSTSPDGDPLWVAVGDLVPVSEHLAPPPPPPMTAPQSAPYLAPAPTYEALAMISRPPPESWFIRRHAGVPGWGWIAIGLGAAALLARR